MAAISAPVLPAKTPPSRRVAWSLASLGVVWFGLLVLALVLHPARWVRPVVELPLLVLLLLVPILLGLELLGVARVFGPVLYFDLIRQARRTRYLLIRFLYAVGLFAIVCWVYWMWWLDHRGAGPRANELSNFAASFFYTCLAVQGLLVGVLTPAYTAGAIAEEKERKTLPFLLATDLLDREIVLSKLLSRLFNVTLTVLVGLPILSILQLLGGIDPTLLLGAFAATAVTAVSLAALSIFHSALTRRARDAIVLTYLALPTYLLLSGLASSWLLVHPEFAASDEGPATLGNLIEGFSSGNIILALLRAGQVLSQPYDPEGQGVWDVVREYAVFHGYLTLGCIGGALVLLRRQALREASLTDSWAALWSWRRAFRLSRRRVSDQPMLWKELQVERGLELHWLMRIGVLILVFLSFLPLFYILEDYLGETSRGLGSAGADREINLWVRLVGSGVGSLLLLGVAIRAAGSISGEMERQTFDSLLTSPLDSDDVLWGKWIGSIFSMRWGALWLGSIWGIGVVTGGLSLLALPLLLGCWLVYAAFAAMLGIFFSQMLENTLRAILVTLGILVALAFGHWLITMFCGGFFLVLGITMRESFESIFKFQVGLTPPLVLGMAAFRDHDGSWMEDWVGYLLGGTLFWALATGAMFVVTSERLRTLMKRRIDIPAPAARRSKAALLSDPEL